MTAIALGILAVITALIGLITAIIKHLTDTRKKASEPNVHPALQDLHATIRERSGELGFGGPRTATLAAGFIGAGVAVALVEAAVHGSDTVDHHADAAAAASDMSDWFST